MRWPATLVVLAARTAAAQPATLQGSAGACPARVSWFLEPSLWFGWGNAHYSEGYTDEIAVRNSAGIILRPCDARSFRIGLSLSRYSGVRSLESREGPFFERSAIGYWGFGPQVEADLLRWDGWRVGVSAAVETGDRRDNNGDAVGGHPLILRLGVRARWQGVVLGVDVLHSNGATYLPPQSNTVGMVSVGFSGKPPWLALASELALYVILTDHYRHD